jgi:membrane-bound serine protease (ClpP class)
MNARDMNKPAWEPLRLKCPVGALAAALVALIFPTLPLDYAQAADGEVAADAEERKPIGEPAPSNRSLGALVRINLPLTAGSDAPLKHTITRARDRLVQAAREGGDGRRPTLVLQIAPAAAAENGGAGSEFEPAYALARLLTDRALADVKTVAWVPRSIRGHGVLVALACEELVMASDAELGDAGVDEPGEEGGPSPTHIAAYREIAESRRIMPVALAEGMINPAAEVVQVESEDGLRFLLRGEVEDYRADHEIISEQVFVPAGTLARVSGREGRQFGFVKYLASDKPELGKALALPVESLSEDQALAADWQPIMLEVKGEITPSSASQLKTLLMNRTAGGVNWVGVRIDSVGGDLAACLEIASTFAALDPNAVRTVAYVPVEARGGAAVIALACDQLIMHPNATLGVGPQQAMAPQGPPPRDGRVLPPAGPRPFDPRGAGGPEPPRDEAVELAAAVATIRDSLAPRTERSWSLMTAMLDPGVEIASYRNKVTGEERLMSAEEVAAMPDAVNWNRGAALAANNEALSLTGAQATAAGVATQTVDTFDQLKQLYALEDVETVEPNWALTLVQALASPGLATFLLFLGFIGMYIEIKTPGVGLGGVVAALAFLLFFWSNYLEGTAEALEILMFVAGLVLLLVEVFVVPGVGVFGLAGALMVIFSLVLASQTFVVPRSQADIDRLTSSIGIVVGAGMAMMALAFVLRTYLPKAPIFNRMVLEPPPPEERVTLSHREAIADFSHLVGQSGEVVSDLRPAGKALIQDELVDVIALGEPLDRGTPITVVSAHANRVVVRRLS